MKRSLLSATVMPLVAAAILSSTPFAAYAQRTAGAGGGATGKTTNESYVVIEVVNAKKDAAGNRQDQPYQVVTTSQLKDLQKQLDDDYKTKTFPEWQDAVKIDPKTPRPLKPVIKRLKTFKTQKVADEYMQKLVEELTAKEDAKADKPKQ